LAVEDEEGECWQNGKEEGKESEFVRKPRASKTIEHSKQAGK